MTKVTSNIFSMVKKLVEAGSTYKEVAEYFKLSTWTVGMIARSESLEEYKNNCIVVRTQQNKKKVEPKEEPKEPIVKDEKLPGGTMSANYQINRIYEALKEQNKFLALISEKMAYIVEQLS